jgi:hypothetical protein
MPGYQPIPESLKHLDLREIQATLIDCNANVRSAASTLGVPVADLRRLTRTNSQLIDIVIEAVEQRLDVAERNLDEALRSADSRRRDAAAFFTLRNNARAVKRGWNTGSSASVDLNLNSNLPPRQMVFRWRNDSDPDPGAESKIIDGWDNGDDHEPEQGKLIEHEAMPESSDMD